MLACGRSVACRGWDGIGGEGKAGGVVAVRVVGGRVPRVEMDDEWDGGQASGTTGCRTWREPHIVRVRTCEQLRAKVRG